MQEKKKKVEEMESAGAAVEEMEREETEEFDLMEQEIDKFNSLLEKQPQEAYRRYGFSLLCSLEPGDMAREILRMREKPEDACDLYNRGVFELEGGKIDKALKDFEKSRKTLMSMDTQKVKFYISERPTLAVDLGYNIYFVMSEQGKEAEGKERLSELLEFAKELFPTEEDLPALHEAVTQIEEEL